MTSNRIGNIFASYIADKGLLSRLYQQLKKPDNKINNPLKKWTKYLNGVYRQYSKVEIEGITIEWWNLSHVIRRGGFILGEWDQGPSATDFVQDLVLLPVGPLVEEVATRCQAAY